MVALNSDQLERYTEKMKKVCYCPRCADDLGAVVAMTSKRPQSVGLISVVISSLKHCSSGQRKTENPILLKCPRLQAKIRNVAKVLLQLNKQTLGEDLFCCLIESCFIVTALLKNFKCSLL